MICTVCGESVPKSYLKQTVICQSCYLYIHKGGIIHSRPPKGLIVVDEKDRPICHVCGQAHNKLGNHIYYKHHMTTRQYKDLFELTQNSKLTTPEYRQMMRIYNNNYSPLVVKKNLLEGGTRTRYVPKDPRAVGNHKKHVRVVSLADADTKKW